MAYVLGLPLSGRSIRDKQKLNHYRCTRHSAELLPLDEHGGDFASARHQKTLYVELPKPALCRFCGRLTEWGAYLSEIEETAAPNKFTGRQRLSYSYCSEHRPPLTGTSNADYRWSLRHGEEYFDLRVRLQKQSQNGQALKQIHPNPAVNWFENRVVVEIDAISIETSDLRACAASQAKDKLDTILPAMQRNEASSILSYIVELIEQRRSINPPIKGEAFASHWPTIKAVRETSPATLEEIAVLVLFSQGIEQKVLTDRLNLAAPFVAKVLRIVVPRILPNADEANISRAAYELIQSKITDRKKEIVALLSSGKNQSEVARTMGIARQEVSRALLSIPPAYRYDKQAR
jgi:DNA-binding CsgD family transcriptional regulator